MGILDSTIVLLERGRNVTLRWVKALKGCFQ